MSNNGKILVSVLIPFSMVVSVCYMSGYWWTFGVDIFSYINGSDLILASAIPFISLGVLSAIGIFIGVILLDKEDQHPVATVRGKPLQFLLVSFDILAGSLIVGTFIHGGDQRWLVIPVLLTLLITSLARRAGLLTPLIKNYSHLNYIFIFVAIYFPIQAYSYGKIKALNVISGKKFMRADIPSITNYTNLRYIGKAGNNFFLWESVEKVVHILSTSKYQHIIIGKSKSEN